MLNDNLLKKSNQTVNQQKLDTANSLKYRQEHIGSAHVWGARGRKFESCHPDQRKSIDNHMIVDAFCFMCILLYSHGLNMV
jgi:hypothetical protein